MDKAPDGVKILETKDSRTRTLLQGGTPKGPPPIDWTMGKVNEMTVARPDPAPEKYNSKRSGQVREESSGDAFLNNKEKL